MKAITTSALALVLSAGLAAPALAQSSATATTDLNIRSGPGPEHEVVGVIPGEAEASLMGCLEGSKWCQVEHNGTTGWAYSDYLIANNDGQQVVVTEYRTTAQVPTVTYEGGGAQAAGVASTAATGAVAGALIGGPVGAAVGGVAGAAVGSAVSPPERVTTYVTENRIDPVYLEGEVVVGAGVPDTVTLQAVPEYEYHYTYVNGQPVLVDPGTREIVYVVR